MSDSFDTINPERHPHGAGSHAVLAGDERQMPACYPIKGNVRDDGTRLYHRPDSRSYGVTKAEIWFDSPSAAEAAGFRLAPTHSEGSTGVSYEPGGSNHPCRAETVEANRAAARAAVAEVLGRPATLAGAGARPAGGDTGGEGMAIEPDRMAFDPALHPYGVGSRASLAGAQARPDGYPIKGNVRRDGSRRYHRPDSTAYASTNAAAWFDSPSAAEAAGFSLAASHPAGADASRYEPGGKGHGWPREQVGAARLAALHGPAATTTGAAVEGGAGASLGLGLAALAATVTLGAAAFDPDRHPYGVGSHGLLANAIAMPDFHPIKGNVRNDGSRRYHRPDSRGYSVTKPEVWFDSPSAAEAAGFRLAPTHPEGGDPAAYEPGGSGHRWSLAEVETDRLRVLHGPDADLGALAAAHASTSADTNLHPVARSDADADAGTATAAIEADAGVDGGTATGVEADRGADHRTGAVVAGAGAAALAAGAVAGALADGGKTDIEKLVTGTFQLTGVRPGTTTDADPAAGDLAGDLATTSGMVDDEAATLVSGSPGADGGAGADDPAHLDAAAAPGEGDVDLRDPDGPTIRLDRTAARALAGVDPDVTREVPAGTACLSGRTGDDAGPTDGDDQDRSGIGAAAVVAGAAGLGLAGAAAAGLLGDDDKPGGGTTTDHDKAGGDTATDHDKADHDKADHDKADHDKADGGTGAGESGRQGRQPPVGREQRAAAAAGAGLAAAGAGAAAAGAGDGKARAADAGPMAGAEGDRELEAAGPRAGAGTTGTVAAGAGATTVNAGRTTLAAARNRRLGPWAWIGGAAALVVAAGLILSQCGGPSTNEATGSGDTDSSAGSSDGSTAGEDEPAGPETSATTTGGSTTAAPPSATSTGSTASTTTAAPAGASSTAVASAAATGDLEAQALAALSAAGFENVTVEVNAGQLTIMGNVASSADSAKAEAALANLAGLAGLAGLENALVVEETPTANAVQADPDYTG